MLLARAFPEMREEATSLAGKLNELGDSHERDPHRKRRDQGRNRPLTAARTRFATYMNRTSSPSPSARPS